MEPEGPGTVGGRSASPQDARPWVVAAVATAPLLAHFLAKVVLWPRAHWAFHYDPEVIFLYTAIDVVEGRPPSHVEHPGTPLTAIGAVLAALLGPDPLGMDALRAAAYTTAFVLTALTTWLLARTVLRGIAWPAAVAACWTYWLCPQTLFRTTVWSPESLYFAFGGAALAAMFAAFRAGAGARQVVLAGLCLGVCVSLKYTFLAWVPAFAAALLLVRRSDRGRGAGAAALACGAALAGFAVGVLPAWGRTSDLFGLVFAVGTRQGMYGQGEVGLPGVSEMGESLRQALVSSSAWHGWLAICVIACGIVLLDLRRRRGSLPREAAGMLAFGGISFALTYGFLLRTGNIRYVMTAGLSWLAIVVASFTREQDARPSAARLRHVLGTVLAVVSAALLVKAVVHDVRDHRWWHDESVAWREQILELARRHVGTGREPVVLWSRRSPDSAFSLGMHASTEQQVRRVQAAFPDHGWYDMRRRRIVLPPGTRSWDAVVLTEADVEEFPEPLGARLGTVWAYRVHARGQ